MAREIQKSRYRIGICGLLWLTLSLLTTAPSAAQTALAGGSQIPDAPAPGFGQLLDELPEPLSPEQIDSILAVLDDGQTRATLRRSLLSQMTEGQSAVAGETLLEQHKRRAVDIGQAFRNLPGLLVEALYSPDENGQPRNPVFLLTILAGHILVGAVAMLLTRRAMSHSCDSLMNQSGGGFGLTLGRCPAMMVIDLVEIGAFCLAIVAGYLVMSPTDPQAPRILEALLVASAGTLLAAKISRTVLAPAAPALRLVPLSDSGARRLQRILVLAFGAMFALNFAISLLAIFGLSRDAQTATGMLLGGLFCGYLIVLVWANRTPVAAALALSFGGGSQAA